MIGKHLKAPLGLTSDLLGNLNGPHGVSWEGHQGILGEKTGKNFLYILKTKSFKEAEQIASTSSPNPLSSLCNLQATSR